MREAVLVQACKIVTRDVCFGGPLTGKTKHLEIGVVGTGYFGLVTGACLSHLGHRVVCVDKDEGRISELKEGRMPFYEPNLEELVSRSVQQERLSFATSDSLSRLVGEAEAIFISVDTPHGDSGSADLSSVAEVARSIGQALAQPVAPSSGQCPLLVVSKSTVPVGSGDSPPPSHPHSEDLQHVWSEDERR